MRCCFPCWAAFFARPPRRLEATARCERIGGGDLVETLVLPETECREVRGLCRSGAPTGELSTFILPLGGPLLVEEPLPSTNETPTGLFPWRGQTWCAWCSEAGVVRLSPLGGVPTQVRVKGKRGGELWIPVPFRRDLYFICDVEPWAIARFNLLWRSVEWFHSRSRPLLARALRGGQVLGGTPPVWLPSGQLLLVLHYLDPKGQKLQLTVLCHGEPPFEPVLVSRPFRADGVGGAAGGVALLATQQLVLSFGGSSLVRTPLEDVLALTRAVPLSYAASGRDANLLCLVLSAKGAAQLEMARRFYPRAEIHHTPDSPELETLPAEGRCCTVGHLQMLETFLQTREEQVVILEGDVLFPEWHDRVLPLVLSQAPEDFDIIFLGWHPPFEPWRSLSSSLFLRYSPLSTHAYLASRRGARLLLSGVKGDASKSARRPLEHWIKHAKGAEIYCVNEGALNLRAPAEARAAGIVFLRA